jgi:hypothetical protein
MGFITYKQVVNTIQSACQEHDYVQSFAHGSIDYLDASSQNISYPYVFLRPLQSPGYNQDTRLMQRSFELYALDIPRIANESPIDIMSRMETVILDIGSYIVWGPPSDNQSIGYDFVFTTMIPTLEAFEDRAYGFVANVNVNTEGTYNYCNYPKT